MRALLAAPTLPLRKPLAAGVLPLSIAVDMVEVSRFGEGDRMLRVEDSLEVELERGIKCAVLMRFVRMTDSGEKTIRAIGRWCDD